LSFISRLSRPRIVVGACLLTLAAACTRGPDPEQVVDGVLTTAPFDGAFAVIVPKILPASCDKLPATDEGKAWTLLVSSGFMMTEPAKASDGAAVCRLLLTDRGANRKRFGQIVSLDNSYEVPVGGIGTDLPTYKTTPGNGDSVNVSFTWQFYRFRGVDGLIALTKLPQRKKGVMVADVPASGRASVKFSPQGSDSWKIEEIRLVQ
jgi:hypothetical protein